MRSGVTARRADQAGQYRELYNYWFHSLNAGRVRTLSPFQKII